MLLSGAVPPCTKHHHGLGGHRSVSPEATGKLRVATTAQLAMYNAAIAMVGGYQPYGAPISASPCDDVRAAVATAAYFTSGARVDSSQVAYLDGKYKTYLGWSTDQQLRGKCSFNEHGLTQPLLRLETLL